MITQLGKVSIYVAFMSINGIFLNAQVLGGQFELDRHSYTVTAMARLLYRIPAPTINYLKINWGDGSPQDSIPFINELPDNANKFAIKYFSGNHTYSPGSVYSLTAGAVYMASNIQNIPNSQTQKLVLKGMINLQVFTEPPTPSFKTYMYDSIPCIYNHFDDYQSNPGMSTPDLDSLSNSIDLHSEIPGYMAPPIGWYNSDPSKGTITFTANASGNYNVSYHTDAWRRSSANGPYNLLVGSSYWELYISVCNVSIAPTGLPDIKSEVPAIGFPNPTRGKVQFSWIENEDIDINFYNTLGQVVLAMKSSRNREIDLSELSSGIYFVHLESAKRRSIFKIIKD
jgi:hypothetical protein